MRIGMCRGYSPETLRFAKEHGFGSLAIGQGPHFDLDRILKDPKEVDRIRRECETYDIQISCICAYPNHLTPDLNERKKYFDQFSKMIDVAALLEINLVASFAGRVPDKGIAENIPVFKEVWSYHADHAEKEGVRIAFENCTMFDEYPFHGINLAYCPEAWDAMFEAVPSKMLGLQFDPSHLIWMMVDYVWAVHHYANRIFHVHAKDTEVNWDTLRKRGFYSRGHGWWRHRIPGFGDVDWKAFISALYDIGYQGNLDIEHEDEVFSGDRTDEGFILGLKHLSQFVV